MSIEDLHPSEILELLQKGHFNDVLNEKAQETLRQLCKKLEREEANKPEVPGSAKYRSIDELPLEFKGIDQHGRESGATIAELKEELQSNVVSKAELERRCGPGSGNEDLLEMIRDKPTDKRGNLLLSQSFSPEELLSLNNRTGLLELSPEAKCTL